MYVTHHHCGGGGGGVGGGTFSVVVVCCGLFTKQPLMPMVVKQSKVNPVMVKIADFGYIVGKCCVKCLGFKKC